MLLINLKSYLSYRLVIIFIRRRAVWTICLVTGEHVLSVESDIANLAYMRSKFQIYLDIK